MTKISKEFLETIASECKKVKLKNNYKALDELRERLLKEYGLKHIGSGISRYVFKQNYGREVIKFDETKNYNVAEYCVSKAMENHSIGSILAKCNLISDDWSCLTQEYIPRRVKEYSFDIDGAWTFKELRDNLEKCFHFLFKWKRQFSPLFDFHEDNIRLTNDYRAKIIDYAPLLYSFSEHHNFSIPSCIKSLSRYTKKHDQKVEFHLDANKHLVLKTNQGIYSTNHLGI
jgi:hypothetical protein